MVNIADESSSTFDREERGGGGNQEIREQAMQG
jgi:hypothetical protein